MRPTRLLAVSFFVVVVAACGSSGSKGAASANNSSPSTVASPSGATTSTVGKVSGNSNSSFCDDARRSENAFKAMNPAQLSMNTLKSELENVGPELQKAESAAPSEIKPDLQTFINAYTPFLNALKAADYDFTKVNFASFTNLDSAAVKAALAHIEAYFTQVCHVTMPTATTVSVP